MIAAVYAQRSIVSWGFALGNVVIALGLLLANFVGRGERAMWLDVAVVALASLLLLSAFGLARCTRWRLHLLRILACVGVVLGVLLTLTVATAAFSLGSLPAGLLAPRATESFTLIGALTLPYLLLYPGAQLLWVQRQLHPAAPAF